MKVLVYSARNFEVPYLKMANNNVHIVKYIEDSLNTNTACLAINYDVISIFSSDKASSIVLEKLKSFGVKFIALRSAGFDNVNLNIAKKLGYKVANVPNYSPYAIAEHATSLLLTLNRKIILSNERVQKYNFNIDGLTGFDLNGKTVGIIGTGRIGTVMAKIMHGFGCNLLGYDLHEDEELIEKYNLKYSTLKELCWQSDIITLHTPLNKETYNLIHEKLIKLMKKGVVLINTSRGNVVNTKHIIDALENKHIGAYGMDVYENEKGVFFKNLSKEIPNDEILKKLIEMPNVLLTSHYAFLTKEALTNIAETTFETINFWKNNKPSPNELLPKLDNKKNE